MYEAYEGIIELNRNKVILTELIIEIILRIEDEGLVMHQTVLVDDIPLLIDEHLCHDKI